MNTSYRGCFFLRFTIFHILLILLDLFSVKLYFRASKALYTILQQNYTITVNFEVLVKPIFHCDAKTFALDPGVGLDPQRQNFVLGIPTCWYLKTRKHPTPNLKFVSTNAKPKRKSVEYRMRWVPNEKCLRWPCTFHVFCVDFICVW